MSRTVFRGGFGFGGLALGAAISASLLACASEPSGEDAPGAIQGELQAISVMGVPNGQRSMIYSLRVPGSTKDLPLDFDADPNLPSKTTLKVWGTDDGDTLHVTRHQVIESETDPELDRLAIIGGPTTERRIAWVQMNMNGTGVNQTVEQANQIIFDRNMPGPLFGTTHNATRNDKTLVQYYDEVSYGMLRLVGQVEGPIPYTGTVCNVFDPIGNAARDAIADMGRMYDHYFLFWGADQNCGTGWGAQGTRSRPRSYIWLDNATFCVATAQEIGHNFGWMHSSTTDCGSSVLTNNMSGCTSSEYGSQLTVMGGGCRHLNAIEKWYQGWLLQCNGVRVNSSATFTLFPIETACNGIQVLQIPFPTGAPTRQTSTSQSNGNVTLSNYYLELRTSVGVDTGVTPGVYVHVAGNVPAPNANGPRTFVLDMQPSSNGTSPMTIGERYDDPAGGVSFVVNSFDATSASVTVTVSGSGANTCIDGTTLQGSGPTTCGMGGMGGMGGGGAGGKGGAGAGGAGAGGAGTGGAGGASGGAAGASGSGGAGGDLGGAGGGGGIDVGGAGGAPGGAAGTPTAGAAGTPGGASSAGTAGAPVAGTGAVATGGSAGAGTPPGGSGTIIPAGDAVGEDGGCGCRIVGSSEKDPVRSAGSLALLALGIGAIAARRRRRDNA
jgi:hypothetical protein